VTRQPHRARLGALVAAAILIACAVAPSALAHAGGTVGDYFVEAGWRDEPPVIDQANAVEVTVTRHDDDSPIADLGSGDLTVVVSSTGSSGSPLALEPAFDRAARTGPLGTYEAELVPGVAGATTFHITGSIHGTAVDLSLEGGVVEASKPVDEEPATGLDPWIVAGIVGLIAVVGAMAFLFLRVRPAS
jgi:hypothetical protein